MTPLRCRIIEDVELAGLAPRSQEIYISPYVDWRPTSGGRRIN